MLERPDYAALIDGHTTIIKMINSGDAGLSVLDQMLQVAQRALGAAGMSFAEYGSTAGRVIAATGAAQWALGRPVNADATRCALGGPVPGDDPMVEPDTGWLTRDVPVESISGELADQLSGRGLAGMLVARAEIGGRVIGTLHAHYARAADHSDPEHHTIMTYLASCLAHMYGDQAGLPIHGDGPVVAALIDGLAIVDREDYIRLWNRAAERVTGRGADEMLNQPLPFPVPPSGQVRDHRLPDGRWLKITSGELPGTVGSRVVTFSDTTDQHQRDHDRELFVAVTSHELRTPVTVIKGYAQTLNTHWDSLTEHDRREAARVLGQRAGELARLVDRLLCAANDASPVGGAPPVPFDLVEALHTAMAQLPRDIRRRLAVDLPGQLPNALGERASVVTVLTELTTNADKYSAPDAPIQLGAEADERTVVFRVSDRGIGIRPEHVERAFDRFWQGESGDRRQYPGAGLGLYLVRRIVERQNGWVSLRPREKGGTVAEVRLPRG